MYILFNSIIDTTLSISIIDSLLIGMIAYLMVLPFIFKKKLRDKIFLLFVFLYASFLFFLTIPIVLEPFQDNLFSKFLFVSKEIIWNPVNSILGLSFYSSIKLIGGNFFLLMPIAIFILIKKPFYSWKKFLTISLLISLGIESAQFIGNVVIGYSFRQVETLDVTLNVSGSLLCFFLFRLVMQKSKKLIK